MSLAIERRPPSRSLGDICLAETPTNRWRSVQAFLRVSTLKGGELNSVANPKRSRKR